MLNLNGIKQNGANDIEKMIKAGNAFVRSSVDLIVSEGFLDTILITPLLSEGIIAGNLNPEIISQFPNFKLELYASPSYSGGTNITTKILNLNTYNPNINKLTLKQGITVTDVGILAYEMKLFGSESIGQTFSGGASKSETLLILNPDTTYLLRMKNESEFDGSVTSIFHWFQNYNLSN